MSSICIKVCKKAASVGWCRCRCCHYDSSSSSASSFSASSVQFRFLDNSIIYISNSFFFFSILSSRIKLKVFQFEYTHQIFKMNEIKEKKNVMQSSLSFRLTKLRVRRRKGTDSACALFSRTRSLIQWTKMQMNGWPCSVAALCTLWPKWSFSFFTSISLANKLNCYGPTVIAHRIPPHSHS